MPNWTIAGATDATVNAGQPDIPVAELTISPSAGYTITPENFTIEGGTETYGGSNIWVYGSGWEGLVSSVTFAQSSTNVTCTAVYNSTVFNADKTVSLGVEESLVTPVSNVTNTAAIVLDFPYNANVSVTITKPGDVAQTNITSGSSSSNHVKKFSITQNGLKDYELVKLTITPNAGHHLISNYGSIPDSNGFRTVSKKNSDGTWDFSAKYTEPAGTNYSSPTSPLAVPRALVSYSTKANSVYTTLQVKKVTATQKIPSYGGASEIVVTGDVNSEYTVKVRNATSGDYYQWDGTWASGSATEAGSLGASGIKRHSVPIGSGSVTTIYNVILAATGSSTLGSDVPDVSGELQIKRYGSNTLTIGLMSEDTADYGTLPNDIEIVRPIRYDGDPYFSLVGETINFTGNTRGSSARLMVGKRNGIQPGMYITGEGIPHNTTVTGVGDGVLLLNTTVNISAITNFKAVPVNTDNLPYSFTVVPNLTPNALTVNVNNNHNTSIWGFHDVATRSVSSEISGSSSISVADANGILRSMAVTGGALGAGVTVNAVNYKTNIVTTSAPHGGISNTDPVYFKGANNPKVSSTYITAAQSGSNVIISGYIYAPVIDNTANVEIFIDDIINAT